MFVESRERAPHSTPCAQDRDAMIRHSVIMLLMLLASAALVLQALSFRTAVFIPCSIHFGPDPQELEWDFGDVLDPDDYTERRGLSLLADRGRLTLRLSTVTDDPVTDWDGSFAGVSATVREGATHYERVSFLSPGTTTYQREVSASLPMWLPIILLGVCPGTALVSFWRLRRRRRLGLCVQCSYDLRGSEGACPECGTGPRSRR